MQKSEHELAKYYRQQTLKARETIERTSEEKVKELEIQVAALTKDRDFLEQQASTFRDSLEEALQEKEILEERVEELEEKISDEVDFKTSSETYSATFVNGVMKLQELHVANKYIVTVIETCLGMVGKRMVNRPALNTISGYGIARLSIAQQQLQV